MKPSDDIKKYMETAGLEVDPKRDEEVFAKVAQARSKTNNSPPASGRTGLWSYVMNVRTVKVSVTAVIIVVLGVTFFGPSGNTGSGMAWGEIVRQIDATQDELLNEIEQASQSGDMEKVGAVADQLSDFWQGLLQLAKARNNPQMADRIDRAIVQISERTVNDRGVDADVFIRHADKFMVWLDTIEDDLWIDQAAFICKQLEEYSENIRDGVRKSENEIVEHCLPAFIEYCRFFEKLPWDDPSVRMSIDDLAECIDRDLRMIRYEIKEPVMRDFYRFAKRCKEQIQRNIEKLKTRLEEVGVTDEKLIEYYDELNEKFVEVISRLDRVDIIVREKIAAGVAYSDKLYRQILKETIDKAGSLEDELVDKVESVLDSCRQFINDLKSDNEKTR